jgi:hypothetical protein
MPATEVPEPSATGMLRKAVKNTFELVAKAAFEIVRRKVETAPPRRFQGA